MKSVAVWLITLAGTCLSSNITAPYLRSMEYFTQLVEQIEDSNPELDVLTLVQGLRQTAGHNDALTSRFLGHSPPSTTSGSQDTNSSHAIQALNLDIKGFHYFDKAIQHLVTVTEEERGVVLTPDGTTVALGPLLVGIETGLTATDGGAALSGLLILTLARHLGLSFLHLQNASIPMRLGPDGCWNNVSAPTVFTLLGTPSLATDALINGGMDGTLLGRNLSGPPEPGFKLSALLRRYYSQPWTGPRLDPSGILTSQQRRQNFRELVAPSQLLQVVLEALRLEGEHREKQLENLVKEGVEEFVHRYMDCPAIIPRCQWGAAPPRGTLIPLSPPLPFLYVHHTSHPSKPCRNIQQCSRDMQAMQHFHQGTRGWQDIGYSFVVGSDGYVYEGRGWGSLGSHTRGHNAWGYGVAIIGDYSTSLPDQHSMELVRHHLAKCGVSRGFLQANYTLLGHRQVVATACPGDALYAEIRTWDHYRETDDGQ